MDFYQGMREIRRQDQRYDTQAYVFVREVLTFTLEHVRPRRVGHPHADGAEILEGFRQLTLREFGPMALFVVQTWGLNRCRDVGNVVYNLINAGVFGKSEEDSLEDFQEFYSFEEAFDHRRPRRRHEV